MSDIIINENGESIWGDPQERLFSIEKTLEYRLEEFKNKIAENEKRMYPQKLNFMPSITNILDAYLRKRPLVPFGYAIDIPTEVLQSYADAFFDLLIFIRDYVPEYIANKQTFCAFASISVAAFNKLQTSPNAEIVAIIDNLNDSFVDTNIVSAQGGVTNATATFNRIRAKGAGYGVSMTASGDEPQSNTVVLLDNDSVKRQLSSLFGGKLLDKPKK